MKEFNFSLTQNVILEVPRTEHKEASQWIRIFIIL